MSMHATKIAFVFGGTTVIVGADSSERLMAYIGRLVLKDVDKRESLSRRLFSIERTSYPQEGITVEVIDPPEAQRLDATEEERRLEFSF